MENLVFIYLIDLLIQNYKVIWLWMPNSTHNGIPMLPRCRKKWLNPVSHTWCDYQMYIDCVKWERFLQALHSQLWPLLSTNSSWEEDVTWWPSLFFFVSSLTKISILSPYIFNFIHIHVKSRKLKRIKK